MKNFYRLLLLILFGGFVVSGFAQKDAPIGKGVYVGKIKEVAASYKMKAQSATEAEAQISQVLPQNNKLLLKVKSTKKEGTADLFYGEVANTPKSNFYLKIKGGEATGSIIMIEQKKYYSYSSTADGSVYLTEQDIDKILCVGIPEVHDNSPVVEAAKMDPEDALRRGIVGEAVPFHQSLPGAVAVMYLDFDGETVTGTLWNSTFNSGNPIVALPSTLSEAQMTEAWKVMAEDYRPFQINVTTSLAVYNAAPAARRMRVIFTPTNYFYPGAGGVAYIGSFTWGNNTPCWVWNTGGKIAGETGSHEGGHTLTLGHDGRTSPLETYYYGHPSWAPIMGASYFQPVGQWSQGEYPFANNFEDDLFKIATLNGFGYRPDDHGNSFGTATLLVTDFSSSVVSNNGRGVISTRGDIDFFRFTVHSGAGSVVIRAKPDPDHPNLDIYMALYNSAFNFVALSDPVTQGASLTLSLAPGTYYLSIDGVKGNLGANSDYASLGAYTIEVNYPLPVYTTGCAIDLINNFTFNTLVNNSSGCTNVQALGYTNYPVATKTTTVGRGLSYPLSIQSGALGQFFGVWIDYNQDKDYDDPGEFVYVTTSRLTTPVSTTIFIPSTAALGSTRMRVRSNYSAQIASNQSATSFTWGETEDYTINIVVPHTITTMLPISGPVGAGVMLKGTNFTNVTAVRFNGVTATNVYKASTTLLFATVPAGATTGKIEIVNNGLSRSTIGNFTVAAVVSKWTSKLGLTNARLQHASIATTSRIYTFGGRNLTNVLNTLEIYNPSTNTSAAGAPMPVAIRGMAAALGSNGLIYMFGGVSSSAPVASTYRYTPSTNTWTALAPMPIAVFEAAAAATSNGKIYVFGGEPSTAGGTSTNKTYIYTIATNTWTTGANMPAGVQQHSAVTGADGKIYVIGGRAFSSQAPLGRVQIYNPTTNTWTNGAAMPIPKVQFGATRLADGRIIIVGGKAAEPNSTGPFFHTVEIYTPSSGAGTWSSAGPVLPSAYGQQTAVTFNHNVFTMGGSDNTIRNYNRMLTFVPLAPATLTATKASSTSIKLNWLDKSLNESGFVIERAPAATGPFVAIASVGASVKTYTNTGISASTTYFYRVKATNSAGSSPYSNVASASTAGLITGTPDLEPEMETVQSKATTLSVQPNPVRAIAKVSFTVEETQPVQVAIYDFKGKMVKELFNGRAETGKLYQLDWNTQSNIAGMYFSRLSTRKGIITQKIVLLK